MRELFREMKRFNQQLPMDQTIEILNRNNSGVLAVQGDEGYPYTVPMNYFYQDGKIYFHTKQTGHKMDAIKKDAKVSFCVIERDQFISEEYTNHYRSAIAFGKARVLEDEQEIYEYTLMWAEKLCSSETPKHREEVVKRRLPTLGMIVMEIEHVTGKEALELAKNNYT